jgi:hypothetical protein
LQGLLQREEETAHLRRLFQNTIGHCQSLHFDASNHTSTHFLLLGAHPIFLLCSLLSTGLMPPGCDCTGARYGAVEGDDFDGGCTVEGAGSIRESRPKNGHLEFIGAKPQSTIATQFWRMDGILTSA